MRHVDGIWKMALAHMRHHASHQHEALILLFRKPCLELERDRLYRVA